MDRDSLVLTKTANTPTVATATTILAENGERAAFMIQNQDNNYPLKICFGGTATSSVYHLILKACTSAADGTGGTVAMEGPVTFTGIITCYSAGTPSYTVLEI